MMTMVKMMSSCPVQSSGRLSFRNNTNTTYRYCDDNWNNDELMSCPERWEALGGMQPLRTTTGSLPGAPAGDNPFLDHRHHHSSLSSSEPSSSSLSSSDNFMVCFEILQISLILFSSERDYHAQNPSQHWPPCATKIWYAVGFPGNEKWWWS